MKLPSLAKRNFLRPRRWFAGTFAALLIALQLPVPVFAITSDQQGAFNQGALYFDTKASGSCTGSTDITVTTATTGLPSDVVKAINDLKPVYEQAAQATGVPWQLLAAVHYREANNNPNEDLQAGNPIGGGGSQYASYPYGKPTSLEQSAEFAAKQLISLSTSTGVVKKPINVPNPDANAIKDTLFSYNGRAQAYAQQAATLGFDPVTQPYEGSPYVMNNYDAVHRNMKIITVDFGAPDAVDTRFGAFAVYAFLGGGTTADASGGCGAVSGAVAGNAVQTALNYAWPDYHAAPYTQMKPAYATAISKAVANGEYVGGLPGEPGIDCGGFVTRVMRDSGADPNYNWGPKDPRQGPTTSQQAYMDAHPEKYQKLGPQTSTANLQPGDIAINSEHTYLYVGKQTGFNGNSASASIGPGTDRSPMASNAYFTNGAGSFIWYRLIKAG